MIVTMGKTYLRREGLEEAEEGGTWYEGKKGVVAFWVFGAGVGGL